MPILEMNISDGTVVRWPLFLSWIIDYLFRFPSLLYMINNNIGKFPHHTACMPHLQERMCI